MKKILCILKKLYSSKNGSTQRFIKKECSSERVCTQILGKVSVPIYKLFGDYLISYSDRYKNSVWRRAKDIHGNTVLYSGLSIDIMRVCLDQC